MPINPIVMKKIKENHNIITTKQVMELGFSKALLPKYVREGLMERVRQGVYILAGKSHDDMYTMMLRSEKIIFSHETAIFLLGLSDRTPFQHSVTIPSDTSLPNSLKDECKCYYVKPELHSIGLTEAKTTFGNAVRCYNAERCVCDVLRDRNRMDEDTVLNFIRSYVAYDKKDLNLLAEYGQIFHAEDKIRTYLEVLL